MNCPYIKYYLFSINTEHYIASYALYGLYWIGSITDKLKQKSGNL